MTDNSDMPFRKYMDPKVNPLMPGSTVPCEVLIEDQTIIEATYGNLLDPRFNPLMPNSLVDTQPCGHGDTECERKAFIRDLREIGADQDEIDNALSTWQPEPGCKQCSC